MTHAELKIRAISLRRQGLSYSEIMTKIPVAKSTISDWLHSVGLAKHQKQQLTEKKLAAMKRGWDTKRKQRIDRESSIKEEASRQATKLIKDPLWLTGVILYWAEGSKQKPWSPSVRVQFINMDLEAHKIFMKWSKKYLNISDDDFRFEIYIHDTGDVENAKQYWSKNLSISAERIRIYFKHHNLNPHRKNIGQNYYGVLKISVSKSTDLNRKIAGWTEGVIRYLP